MSNEEIYKEYKEEFKKDIDKFINRASNYIMGISLDEKDKFEIRLKIDIAKEKEKDNIVGYQLIFISAFFVVLMSMCAQMMLNFILEGNNDINLLGINITIIIIGVLIIAIVSYVVYFQFIVKQNVSKKSNSTYYKSWLEIYTLYKDKSKEDITDNQEIDTTKDIDYTSLMEELTNSSIWKYESYNMMKYFGKVNRLTFKDYERGQLEEVIKQKCPKDNIKEILADYLEAKMNNSLHLNNWLVALLVFILAIMFTFITICLEGYMMLIYIIYVFIALTVFYFLSRLMKDVLKNEKLAILIAIIKQLTNPKNN